MYFGSKVFGQFSLRNGRGKCGLGLLFLVDLHNSLVYVTTFNSFFIDINFKNKKIYVGNQETKHRQSSSFIISQIRVN